MSKLVIGIHGLGNKPPRKMLKRWWRTALREGLTRIGYPLTPFRFELVYWADILHPEPLDPRCPDPKDPLYLLTPYQPGPLTPARAPSPVRQKILDLIERQVDRIILKDDFSINFSALTDIILHRFFKDLEVYYSHSLPVNGRGSIPAKELIRERLQRVLRDHAGDRILLIGHSMGTLIAYDVLAAPPYDIKVEDIYTLGSPLGIPVMVGKIAAEQRQRGERPKVMRTPESVLGSWHNFSDLEDKVAFNYNLSDDYGPNSRGVRPIDHVVVNDYVHLGQKNPHKSYGYLRTPELALCMLGFLTRNWPSTVTWMHERLNRSLGALLYRKRIQRPGPAQSRTRPRMARSRLKERDSA